MAKLQTRIDVFLPNQFLSKIPCIVLGYCFCDKISLKVNCLVAFPMTSRTVQNVEKIITKLQKSADAANISNQVSVCKGYFNCHREFVQDVDESVQFSLKIEQDSFLIDKVWLKDNAFEEIKTRTLVIYDCEEILTSEMLYNGELKCFCKDYGHHLCAGNNSVHVCTCKEFLQFLRWSLTAIAVSPDIIDEHDVGLIPCLQRRKPSFPIVLGVVLSHLLFIVLKVIDVIIKTSKIRIFASLKRVLMMSACSRQIVRKFSHLQEVAKNLKNGNMNLRSANLLSALIVDMLCGIIVTYILLRYVQLFSLLSWIEESTNMVVDELKDLLQWLMGVPAGLKLNRPLNNVLGTFFSYHIYLLKTYIVVIKPFVAYVLEMSFSIGLLGISFFLCLASDLFSLATIHIYCFYGYAARLYSLMVAGLVAYWRLFRGKKWNPLRKRVDSYEYDVQQLFIGTLVLTVLIFLLPTVALYYAVFMLLRILVLTIQELLLWVVHLISILPVYVIILHISGSNKIKGDVYFSIFSCCMNTVTLTMKAIPLSLMTSIKSTISDDSIFSPKPEWSSILHSLLMGKIIYPL